MNAWILVCQPIMLGFLLVQYQFVIEAESRQIDYSVGGWFGSLEKKYNTDADQTVNNSLTEQEVEDEPQPLKKKKVRKSKKTHRDKTTKPVVGQKFKKFHKKKQAKKGVIVKKFVKTIKSNVSESDESVRREKPVDIIVHIKMNDYL